MQNSKKNGTWQVKVEGIDINLIQRSLPLLLKGAWMTVQIFLFSSGISLAMGGIMGSLLCRELRSTGLGNILEAITFILRAVPFYVQLLIAYFILPDLLNLRVEAFTVSVWALGICSSAYTAQVVRCGIDSIPKEQWESAFTLGYSKRSCMRWIILPQMVRNVLPALLNEMEALLKSTAILSSIGLLELTRMGMNIVSREMEPLSIYLTVAIFYVFLSLGMNLFSKKIEKRLKLC